MTGKEGLVSILPFRGVGDRATHVRKQDAAVLLVPDLLGDPVHPLLDDDAERGDPGRVGVEHHAVLVELDVVRVGVRGQEAGQVGQVREDVGLFEVDHREQLKREMHRQEESGRRLSAQLVIGLKERRGDLTL